MEQKDLENWLSRVEMRVIVLEQNFLGFENRLVGYDAVFQNNHKRIENCEVNLLSLEKRLVEAQKELKTALLEAQKHKNDPTPVLPPKTPKNPLFWVNYLDGDSVF